MPENWRIQTEYFDKESSLNGLNWPANRTSANDPLTMPLVRDELLLRFRSELQRLELPRFERDWAGYAVGVASEQIHGLKPGIRSA